VPVTSISTPSTSPVADWQRHEIPRVVAAQRAVYPVWATSTAQVQGKSAVCAALPGEQDLAMSEPFRPYEKLVEITVLGKKFQVPDRNSLLRCFQFISPETIPYGRFCWNQDCQYCRVSCQLPDDDESRDMLACKFIVMPGMEVTELSQELKWCLRSKLPAEEPIAGKSHP
jgi:hypothetical protein